MILRSLALLLAVLLAQPAAAAPFEGRYRLEGPDGATVTDQDFHGRWQLVYFGFTQCPDVCPTVLNQVAVALRDLGAQAGSVQPIFITLDPDQDRPEQLTQYLAHFDRRILGLRGSAQATRAAADAFRVYVARKARPGRDQGDTIEHSSFLFLMKPDGGFARLLQPDGSGHRLAEALRRLLQ